MKTIVCLSLLTSLSLNITAKDKNSVNISNIRLEKKGTLVHLSLDIAVGRHSAREYKIITPEIKGIKGSKDFAPIGIASRRAQLLTLRNEHRNKNRQSFIHCNGSSFTYTDSILYENWMNGGKLLLNYTDSTCCRTEVVYAKVKVNPVKLVTTKNTIMTWNTTNNEAVYFAQGKAELDHRSSENHKILDKIHDALREIISDAEKQLVSIEIAGYASPEGLYQRNMQLSCDRANIVKEHLLEKNPELDDSLFQLNCKGENWDFLHNKILTSGMPYKQEVLQILENTGVDDGGVTRKKALHKLKNGMPYKYMLDWFYPDLRNARDITITYISTEEIDIVYPEKDT